MIQDFLLAVVLTVDYADEPRQIRTSRSAAALYEALPLVWKRLAACESSSTPSRINLRAVSPSGLHHGPWQVHKGFYKPFRIDPETATLAQHWKVAQAAYKRQGAKAWTCAKKAGLK